MQNTSSITDKPISGRDQDKLRVKRYADTLAKFMQNSDTPLTVGLQGEWGTGKTSMMYMLREILDAEVVATSWVNTWEYSMFRGAKETTPAILKGMLEKLKESCVEKGTWSRNEERSQKVKKIGKFIGNLANQVVRNQTGLDAMEAAGGPSGDEELATEVSFIKQQINEVITDLIEDSNNKYNRVIFFVDDLDRIPPQDAVEVLEALKNMFDVPNCIYVLAIDYEVVVKGLESKFGKKTEANEREFRSFFDKIIQVPFSMPTGTYDIQELLLDKLRVMNISIPENQKSQYAEIVKYTVGYNPRSLKRFINSFSLLRSLREVSEKKETETPFDDLVLFGLLGMQISYNQIFRLIIQDSRFWAWDSGTASKFKVNLEKVIDEVESFGEEYQNKVDESWEQIIFGFCNLVKASGRPDPYLSARWENIVDLLNLLGHSVIGKDFVDATDDQIDKFQQAWNNGLSFAAITNVDDDPSTIVNNEKKRVHVKFESIQDKAEQLRTECENQQNYEVWKAITDEISKQTTWANNLTGSYIAVKNGEGRLFFKLFNPTGKRPGVTASVNHIKERKGKRQRPESELINKILNKTEFKLKITDPNHVQEALEIFGWALENS